MSAKHVSLREQAVQDVDEAISYFLKEHAQQAAADFVDALERAYGLRGRRPGVGTAHYGHELDLRGLRTVPVGGFPYLVFYVERDEYVDVWRVLHTSRDIPASFAGRE